MREWQARSCDRYENESPNAALIRAKLARELDPDRTTAGDAPAIPDHALLCQIGSGSYGDVWLARNALGSLRAVKIVYRARFKEDRPYEREFQGILKYEPISRTHEGLVQVLHVGRNDAVGCFYYVMELADDAHAVRAGEAGVESPASYRSRTIGTELSRQVRLAASDAASLVLRLAKALGHLHANRLVHRDIKPSNVIFVRGQPKLADIGLVTDMGSSRSFVGTEGFIPPEGPGTPTADVYALGKLLYELATGRDRMDFPQLPPRMELLRDADALLELNEVITRACAPEVNERYAGASEFEADLNSFLAGRSLRRARSLERHLARLKRMLAAGSVFLTLLAMALLAARREGRHALEVARIANERAQVEQEGRVKETTLRLRAEAAEHQTQQQLYSALVEQARATVRSREPGQRFQSLEAIRRAAAISNTVELRREALAALTLPDLSFQQELPFGADFTLRWMDPHFRRIAVCRGRGAVEIRSIPDNELLATLPASANLMSYGASWSKDGRYLAVKRDYNEGGHRADLEVWNVDAVRRVLLLRDVRYNSRAFHPDEPQLLVAEEGGWVSAWGLEEGKEVGRRRFDATPENLAYSPDGKFVVASYAMTHGWGVSIHAASSGDPVAAQLFSNVPSAVAWHPDGTRVAVTDYSGKVQLMDARTGELRSLGHHKTEAATAVFSPSGDYLLTGGWERELICWDVRTMQRALTIAFGSYVSQFSSDGRVCALLTQTGIQLHEFESPSAHRELAPWLGPRLWHATFSPDGRWLAAAADRMVGVWDLATNAPGTFARAGPETQLFWTADSRELFGSSRSDSCFRWRVQPGTNAAISPVLQSLELTRPIGFESLCLTSNLLIWTGSLGSRSASLAELADQGDWRPTISGISKASPDGRWLAIYRAYGQILHVYQLPEMEAIARLTNRAGIAGINFSPQGEEIAVVSPGQVEFWNMRSWERTRMAENFIGISHVGMLFEPEGRSMWLLKDFKSAGLYDSRKLEPIMFLPKGKLPLAVDHTGQRLAVSQDAQSLQVWDLSLLRAQLRELGLDWAGRFDK